LIRWANRINPPAEIDRRTLIESAERGRKMVREFVAILERQREQDRGR
jgi:hypothetical protein